MLILVLAAVVDPAGSMILLARLYLLAQAVPGELGPWLTALNLGVSGIVLWLFVVDKIAPTTERNALREEVRRRNEQDRETLIPLLTRVLDVLARVAEQSEWRPK